MSSANKYCDLHTHSNFSDGTWTPTEIVAEAKRLGIPVALCDHDEVLGLPEFVSAAEEMGVEAVPGVEISTVYGKRKLHVLGLFLRPEGYAAITSIAEDFLKVKAENNRILVSRLCAAGYEIDLDKIIASTRNGYVNRSHIGAELTALGYTSSIEEAFNTVLSPEQGFYTPTRRADSLDVIDMLKAAGAVVVLAHPLLNMCPKELEEFLPEAISHGVDGIEVMHSDYTPEMERTATELAARFGLLMSGGSDFHGDKKNGIHIATGRGNMKVPYEFYEKLKKRAGW